MLSQRRCIVRSSILVCSTVFFLLGLTLLAAGRGSADDAVQLTYDLSGEQYPDWSPDGTQLVFQSDRSGNWDIWVMPSTGGAATQVTVDTSYDARASWCPVGNEIVFETDRTAKAGLKAYPRCDIFMIPVTGGTPTQITTYTGYDERPDWSPDGTHIIFSADRPSGEFLSSPPDDDPLHLGNLWIIPVTGEPAVQLTFDTGYENDAAWSPDGSTIALMADYGGSWDIWIMPATGGTPTQLTSDPGQEDEPCWSPSGEYIAYRSRPVGSTSDIWMIPAAGGAPIQVTDDHSGDWGPSWSPDGTKIAFYSNRSGNYDIWVIDVPGAGIEPKREGTSWGSIKSRFEDEQNPGR
jgi:Tol biopolymer transport system component